MIIVLYSCVWYLYSMIEITYHCGTFCVILLRVLRVCCISSFRSPRQSGDKHDFQTGWTLVMLVVVRTEGLAYF
jgi:hypothetical protein